MKVMRRCVEDCKPEVAIVGVLYRRGAQGPMIADAVSFGTRPLLESDTIPADVAPLLRHLPVAPYGAPVNPWTPAQRPTITVPAVDFAQAERDATALPTDFVIDLWYVLDNVHELFP